MRSVWTKCQRAIFFRAPERFRAALSVRAHMHARVTLPFGAALLIFPVSVCCVPKLPPLMTSRRRGGIPALEPPRVRSLSALILFARHSGASLLGCAFPFPCYNPPGKRRPCEKPSCVASERTCAVRSVSLPSPTVWLRHQEFSPVRTFFIGAKREYMCVDRGKASSGRHKHRVA